MTRGKVTLENAARNVGRLVVYRSPGWPEHRFEEGTITSVGSMYVFVRFPGGSNGVACDAANLRYAILEADEEEVAS